MRLPAYLRSIARCGRNCWTLISNSTLLPTPRRLWPNSKNAADALAILSNGSPRMLAAAVDAAGMAGLFDAVLSVDSVRAYKPRPEVYALVTARFSIKPEDVCIRLVQPVGRHGRVFLRLRHGVAQSRPHAERI